MSGIHETVLWASVWKGVEKVEIGAIEVNQRLERRLNCDTGLSACKNSVTSSSVRMESFF